MHFRNVFFFQIQTSFVYTPILVHKKLTDGPVKKQYTLPTSLHGMGYNFPWPKCAEENLKQKQMINMHG